MWVIYTLSSYLYYILFGPFLRSLLRFMLGENLLLLFAFASFRNFISSSSGNSCMSCVLLAMCFVINLGSTLMSCVHVCFMSLLCSLSQFFW
ncbi:uncharacterized protein B0P05DRAFT_561694 [Gilbertella persicaria]|uniref:uncharacterized protein n=1 Tax=Gilbertella persicaria TaxID=101096 RepID=UPI00221F9E86|nr:uncharacterized protein B0P05DRAFT_561694 [Gilbertella persicaria]KAI8053125.1 hypothetical protein B0P05DRAFT_561694 [Gilbertella persicaria]